MALSLPIGLDYSFGATLQDTENVHEVRMEGSISVRSQNTPHPNEELWTVEWKLVTRVEKESLKTVFRDSGGVHAITFLPPQEITPILVVAEKPRYRHVGYDNWDVSVTFRQVFDDE